MTKFKSIAVALLLATGAAMPAAAQQLAAPVIVIVDQDRAIAESAAGKAALTELQNRGQQLQARVNTLQTQLQTEAQGIQQAQQAKTPQAQLEQRITGFQQRQRSANEEVERGRVQLAQSQQYVVQQIGQAMQPIITQLMRERGAAIVLSQNSVIMNSASLDITNDVIARLNQSTPRVSTTPPAQPAAAPGARPAQPAAPAQQPQPRRQ